MMTNNKFSKEKYDSEQLVIIHGHLLDEMQTLYKLPKIFKLTQCFCRKDVQLFSMTTSQETWEQAKIEYVQMLSLEKYMQIIMGMSCAHMREKLEVFYSTKIAYWYILCPHIIEDKVYAYSLKIFENPLFKSVEVKNGNSEDRLTRIASSHIRYLTGRGPERITTTILNDQLMVICVFGIIPLYIKKYISDSSDDGLAMCALFINLLTEVINKMFEIEYNYVPEKLIKVDFDKNLLVAVVTTRQCENGVVK